MRLGSDKKINTKTFFLSDFAHFRVKMCFKTPGMFSEKKKIGPLRKKLFFWARKCLRIGAINMLISQKPFIWGISWLGMNIIIIVLPSIWDIFLYHDLWPWKIMIFVKIAYLIQLHVFSFEIIWVNLVNGVSFVLGFLTAYRHISTNP